jgi:hypothetical protein
VALLFALLDFCLKRTRAIWIVYAVVVMYVAINVPVTRLLSTPLTLPMLRAARGPLRDSIAYYFNPVNLGAIVLVLAAGAGFPLLLCRFKLRFVAPIVIAGFAIVAVGPVAVSKVETVGLYRNAFGALIPARRPTYSGTGRKLRLENQSISFEQDHPEEIAIPRCGCRPECGARPDGNPRHPGIYACMELPRIPLRI